MDKKQNSYFENEEMDEFFSTLPPHIQESVMQALPRPKNVDELRSVARKFYC